ncbi:MAG: hypothetical protein IPG69_02925 [Flavobacteriales bacterium]|nr:hypothetical protein [Flavobacteriales bacterium]
MFLSSGQQVYIEWDDFWNPAGFNWELSFAPCTPDPSGLSVNQSPSANQIAIGNPPVVFTGDLDCEPQDGISPNPYADATGWEWKAFELTQCANVQISYCGTASFQYGSLNMYGDCGTLFINSQSYDFTACVDGNPTIYFEDLSPGFYYYPVLWSLSLDMVGPYRINVTATAPTNPCPTNLTCATATPMVGNDIWIGNTSNQFPSLPANACPFPNSPGSGGALWYSYTPVVNENVVVSTCGAGTAFDTRVDVYSGTCGTLSCVAMADDKGGSCTDRSQLEFYGQAGVTYSIVVPSATPLLDGQFEIAMGCGAPCLPPANDMCGTAAGLTTYLTDNETFSPGVPTAGDNSCAQNDPFTSCSQLANNQGMWYSFNSGDNTIHYVTLNTFDQDNLLTSTSRTIRCIAVVATVCKASLTQVA